MKTSTILLLFIAVFLTGCATATRGTQEKVRINTEPPGATAISNIALKKAITLDNGTESTHIGCAPTPCSVNFPRKSSPVISIEKEGFQPLKVKIVSSWATASRSIAPGSIVAGIPPGSHAIAGSPDLLKRIPIQGAMFSTGLLSFGVAPVVDIVAGSNRSLSPNPVTIFLAPIKPGTGQEEAP